MRTYRHVIVFQKPPEYTDGQLETGEPEDDYTDFKTVRASVEALPGMHDVHEKQSIFRGFFKFCIRYQEGISPQFRIKFGTRYFNIIHMQTKDEIHRFIEIHAQEIQ